jgi:hypothetical protein
MSDDKGQPEMTFRQFIESTWFKAFSRWASILGFGAASAVGGYLLTIGARVDVLEADRPLLEQKFSTMTSKVDALGRDIDKVASDVVEVKEDVALSTGILQQMQREQLASWRVPPPTPIDEVSTSTRLTVLP